MARTAEIRPMITGVIGAGKISDVYLRNMIGRYDELKVKCIASLHIENARKKAARYHLRACTTEELLKDEEIELAVILTPVDTHYALIKSALLAGKHVYSEKTLTDDPVRAKELLALADEKGLALGCAPDTFLGPAMQKARDLIDAGELGEIQSFAISVNRNSDALLSVYTFLQRPGCGVLYDYAVYYITCLCRLLGPVQRVSAIIRNPYPNRKNTQPGADYGKPFVLPNETQAASLLEMASGIAGTLQVNADSLSKDQAYFALYGTRGILYLTNPNRFGGTLRLLYNSEDPDHPVREERYDFAEEDLRGIGPADLVRSLRNNTKPNASKELAYHVLDVLSAMLESGRSGSGMISVSGSI
jgi:predicted dehydrogenase